MTMVLNETPPSDITTSIEYEELGHIKETTSAYAPRADCGM